MYASCIPIKNDHFCCLWYYTFHCNGPYTSCLENTAHIPVQEKFDQTFSFMVKFFGHFSIPSIYQSYTDTYSKIKNSYNDS